MIGKLGKRYVWLLVLVATLMVCAIAPTAVLASSSGSTTTEQQVASAEGEAGGSGAKTEVDVGAEFKLHPLSESLHFPKVGPFDFSITKAVVYLWLTLAVIIIGSILVNVSLKNPAGRLFGLWEGIYDLARKGIVESVMNKGQDAWFPYIASLFIFIFVSNLVGLIPLPFGHHNGLAFYGATANLYVTVMLAILTFLLTHIAGFKTKGFTGYFKGMMIESSPPVLKQMLFVLHLISEIFRLISLAVRLFANIVAGHAILAVFYAMAVVFQFWATSIVLEGASIALYLFEIFVAFIQAFIFAILSAIYIGGAIEEGH